MVYSNELVKQYILRSFVEVIEKSYFLRSFENSCSKLEIYSNLKKGYVLLEAYCREKRFDDETKWIKHYSRKIGAGEILRIMQQMDNEANLRYYKKPIGDCGYQIWEDISGSEEKYYSDKE